MLWIALHFPQLAIDCVSRGHGEALLSSLPLVIHAGPAQRPTIYAVNSAAREAGLKLGMALAAARAVCGTLTAMPRSLDKEESALQRLAIQLAQFTPSVTIDQASHGIMLEVSTSMMLFGGIAKLIGEVRCTVRTQGFQALVGIAPTPMAAQLLARLTQYQPSTRMCRDVGQLTERLADVPLALFNWPHETINTLATLGLTRIKDLYRLPRHGLQQRFGDTVLNDLDRARGLAGDPRQYIVLPENFTSGREFLFEIHEIERLMPFAETMFIEMEGFLRARGTATANVVVTLKHGRNATTQITLGTREPARHATHWLRLLGEKFSRSELAAAVIEMSVCADQLCPYLAKTNNLLRNTPVNKQESISNLMDRLAARLGEKAVYQIEVNNDHRPEFAWRKRFDTNPLTAASGQIRQRQSHAYSSAATSSAITARRATVGRRPSWILREPRALVGSDVPQYHGPLTLLTGPERIETGWWDGKPVARDYFVAQNPQQEVCWIYRDYRFGSKWYLHGLFA
jgi:protein ImuB